ncbi:hypothetical protein BDV23DRAFT_178041 [Aspergillus alliaceus]|uniref:Uncharacterized protein n=1 Tax=Petromyces alliaceus TaxID=209559 RepID=A0A5N7CR10_PETAA|nr:hypothetical protein BDV23DRAFT_178041 [Aspergillus alliaceus]
MANIIEKIRKAINEPYRRIDKVNRQCIPLCLLSHTTSPGIYALGLSCYGEMYFGFEDAQDALLASVKEGTAEDDPGQNFIRSLKSLGNLQLSRSKRLEDDLSFLCLFRRDHILLTATDSHITSIRKYIQQRIMEKQHRLLAYAFVMYSALFNGGKVVREMLVQQTDHDFWGLPDLPEAHADL